MGLIRWIVGFAIALLTVAFAVLNLKPVPLVWSPFHDPIELPLYLVGLGLMAIGFLIGALTVWLNTDPLHLQRWHQRKKIKNLEKEIKTLHEGTGEKAPENALTAIGAPNK